MSQQEQNVPVFKSIDQVYTISSKEGLEKQHQRYQTIEQQFEKSFGAKPEYFTRAPGRVNLIGEHVDYSGYGVLPMALENDVITGARVTLKTSASPVEQIAIKLSIGSVLPGKYTVRQIETSVQKSDAEKSLSEAITINANEHTWSNYVLCATKGVFSLTKVATLFNNSQAGNVSEIHFFMMIEGNVPTGSGLSSSSALVCSTSLCVMHGLITAGFPYKELSKLEIARLTASCERFIGVQSGGMDQAISFLGQANLAQYITFEPTLANENVYLPEGIQFIVTHTLVSSNKKETAAINYNKRVVECRLSCVLLSKALLNQVLPKWETLNWLQKKVNKSFEEMEEECKKHLKAEPYTLQDVANELGMDVETLRKTYFSEITKLEHENVLKLRDRAVHVYSEAGRVIKFRDQCNKQQSAEASAPILGELMNQSHASCRDQYEASCPELETLTGLATSTEGCLGSRLTGAGWGGCSVSLVKESAAAAFCDKLWNAYYVSKQKELGFEREEVLFASKPAQGAAVIRP